jgi:hypothetical protein
MEMITEDDAKVPQLAFELPAGYLTKVKDGDEEREVVLKHAVVREMTGFEEDLLAEDSTTLTSRFHQIIGACLLSLSDDNGNEITDRKVLNKAPAKMLVSDLTLAMIKIRQASLGDELRFAVTCHECTRPNSKTEKEEPTTFTKIFNLNDLDIASAEGEGVNRVREFQTSRGRKVTWEMMNGLMEHQLSKVRARKKDRVTEAMLVRVRTIDNEPVTADMLKGLSFIERSEIRDQFDLEGGVETSVQVMCPNCGHEFETPLEMKSSDFFARSEESKI